MRFLVALFAAVIVCAAPASADCVKCADLGGGYGKTCIFTDGPGGTNCFANYGYCWTTGVCAGGPIDPNIATDQLVTVDLAPTPARRLREGDSVWGRLTILAR